LRKSARTATILLKYQPYKTTTVHVLQLCDPVARINFCNYYLQSAQVGEIDPELSFFADKAWFYVNGHVNTQNSQHWGIKNHLLHEIPLCDVKACVWCALTARMITGPTLLWTQF
jgi:hypothetical protein